MTLSITDNTSVLAGYIRDLIEANKVSLGIKQVLFGNQNDIPYTPTVVVTPGIKRRELRGVAAPGGRTINRMQVFVLVMTSKVGDEATERMNVDKLSEAVEKLLHTDVQMGGLIIHGFVNNWTPTETFFQQTQGQFRTVRMTYEGMSETYLSQ